MGVPLTMAGGIAGAAGSIQQGYASAGAANYNAKIAEQNAALATQNAGIAGAEGEQAYGMEGIKSAQTQGNIKVAQAANNVDVNSGSAKQVQRSQAVMSALSEANIRSNAARQAYGFETQATSDMAQSALYKSQAKQDIAAGFTGAGISIAKAGGEAAFYNQGGDKPSGDAKNFPQGRKSPIDVRRSFLGQQEEDNYGLWHNETSSSNIFGGM